jgi:hypothetical protein
MGIKVSKEQAKHFKAVVAYYQCPPEEVEVMRAAYESDPGSAAACFAAIAAHIEVMAGPVVPPENSITGEQFLRMGVVAKEMEAMRDAQ